MTSPSLGLAQFFFGCPALLLRTPQDVDIAGPRRSFLLEQTCRLDQAAVESVKSFIFRRQNASAPAAMKAGTLRQVCSGVADLH
jgi:hypothetical protein